MRIFNKGTPLTIGRTSASPTTTLESGATVVEDAHWTEIVSRYRQGLAPHLASGRLLALPDEIQPIRHDVDPTVDSAPGLAPSPAPEREPSPEPEPAEEHFSIDLPDPEPEPDPPPPKKKRRPRRKKA